jgi:hypothetical protein
MNRTIFLYRRLGEKQLNKESKLFCKKGVSEKILELFSLKKRLGLKGIILKKRHGQGCGATGPAHWEKWVVALGRCGKRRQDEK